MKLNTCVSKGTEKNVLTEDVKRWRRLVEGDYMSPRGAAAASGAANANKGQAVVRFLKVFQSEGRNWFNEWKKAAF